MTAAERCGELEPAVEVEFRKFVDRVGGIEKAGRILFAENHHYRERIRAAKTKPQPKAKRSPYRE